MMDAIENYYFGNGSTAERVWDSLSKKTIVVPIILATDIYIERMRQEIAQSRRGNIRSRIARVREEMIDVDLRKPTISAVVLHPEYDIIRTGGPLGSHYLI